MTHVAKLFTNGRSQAVRLPAQYRFEAQEVYIRRDPQTGDVILSRKPATWDAFLAALPAAPATDFLSPAERDQSSEPHDPFEGWVE